MRAFLNRDDELSSAVSGKPVQLINSLNYIVEGAGQKSNGRFSEYPSYPQIKDHKEICRIEIIILAGCAYFAEIREHN